MLRVPTFRVAVIAMTLYSVVFLAACGGGSSSSPMTSSSGGTSGGGGSVAAPGNPPTGSAQQPLVVVVMEENHGFEQVIGNSAMPYLNSLARQGALATQYYANVHPSIGNYLELTTGAIATTDDNFGGVITSDNLAREIVAGGKTWKTYADEIPSAGYLGGDSGNYLKHHNPFAFFSDVINDPSQAARIVPFNQFAMDLNAGNLPAFSFLVPSQVHDATTCPGDVNCNDTAVLSTADQWLQSNISPLLSNSRFQSNGVLLVLFDEADLSDTSHGGGHVVLIAVGPKAKAGVQSSAFYQHENTLRTICTLLSLGTCPGAGASATAETDLVQP